MSITKYRISEGRAARRGRTSRKKQQVLRAEEKTEVDRSVPLVCVVNQREELKEELEFLRGEMGKIEEGISQNARVAPVKEMHDEAK